MLLKGAARLADHPHMATNSCDCCGQAGPLGATLRRRTVRQQGVALAAAEQPAWSHPLCSLCAEWLTGLVLQARKAGGQPLELLGSPVTNGRALMLEGQCQVCRVELGPTSGVVEWLDTSSAQRPWLSYTICPACDGWIGSLADDGRSARGKIGRELDGAYGAWLHPNLRKLTVTIDVADAGARAVVEESCGTMGVAVKEPGEQPPADVLLVEVSKLASPGLVAGPGPAARILLAPLSGHDALIAGLKMGGTDWLTIPVTPQQVSAALTRAMRQWKQKLPWDEETALPNASLEGDERPALEMIPAPGVARFELAWLLKRFLRGYDEVVVANGAIVVIPRVVAHDLGAVAARIERVLHGRCTTGLYEPAAAATRVRFEAAG